MAGKAEMQLYATEDPAVTAVGEDEEQEKPDDRCALDKTASYALNFCNHVLIFLVTVFLLYLSAINWSATDIHVALCTVGYVLLMSEAISVLSKDNVWSISFSRRLSGHVHWILQLVGIVCSIAGVLMIYVKKKSHFRSTHAIIGLSSVVIMLAVATFGLPVMYAMRFRKIVRPVVVKFAHNFLGISCFVLGMLAQCYGYQKTWMSWAWKSTGSMETACLVATAFITLLSLRGALRSLYYQGKSLFR